MSHVKPKDIEDMFRISRPQQMLMNKWKDYMDASLKLFEKGPFDNDDVPVMLLAVAYADGFVDEQYNKAKDTLTDPQKERIKQIEEGIDYAREHRTRQLFNLPWKIVKSNGE